MKIRKLVRRVGNLSVVMLGGDVRDGGGEEFGWGDGGFCFAMVSLDFKWLIAASEGLLVSTSWDLE